MEGKVKEAVFDSITIPLQYDDHRSAIDAIIDDNMLSWTVAQVKEHFVSHKDLAHLKHPPEFLDLVVLGKKELHEEAGDQETVLENTERVEHYINCLLSGHLLVLRKRRCTWCEYSTYLKRRAKQICVDGVFVSLLLIVTVAVGGVWFGSHNFKDILWWQH